MSEQIPRICDGCEGESGWAETKHYRVSPGPQHGYCGKPFTYWYCVECCEKDRKHGWIVEEIGAHES